MGAFCLLDDEGVIHRPKPHPGWVVGRADGSGFKVLHKQVDNQRADGGAHGHTMYLFIILTLEDEKGTFSIKLKDGNDVVNGQVLLLSCGSCCSLPQMMSRAGSTRTNVNRVFMS